MNTLSWPNRNTKPDVIALRYTHKIVKTISVRLCKQKLRQKKKNPQEVRYLVHPERTKKKADSDKRKRGKEHLSGNGCF